MVIDHGSDQIEKEKCCQNQKHDEKQGPVTTHSQGRHHCIRMVCSGHENNQGHGPIGARPKEQIAFLRTCTDYEIWFPEKEELFYRTVEKYHPQKDVKRNKR